MSDLHSESNVPLNCEQVDLLLSADIEEDPDLTSEERSAIAVHLERCRACREIHEHDREIMQRGGPRCSKSTKCWSFDTRGGF